MLKTMLKRAFHNVGLEVKRYSPTRSEETRFLTGLTHHGVNLVFDVGANEGQFAQRLRESGYSGRIVSFEPIAGVWEKLKRASENDPL